MKSIVFILVVLSLASGMRHRRDDSIFAQVSAKLTGGGPMQEILDLLDSLKADIAGEQAEHDSQYDRYGEDCETEQTFRREEIDDAETALDRIVPEKNSCLTERDASKDKLIKNREN